MTPKHTRNAKPAMRAPVEKYCRTFFLHGASPLSRCTPTAVCLGGGFEQAPASHEREDMQTFLGKTRSDHGANDNRRVNMRSWYARSVPEGRTIFGSFARTYPKAYLRH